MRASNCVGEFADAFFVGAAHHKGAYAVVENLFHGHDFAADVWLASHHHIEALIEHNFGAALQGLVVNIGVQAYPHLAAARGNVDGAVVVLANDHAVCRRRLGELGDLVAKRRDVLSCLAERVAELLVL